MAKHGNSGNGKGGGSFFDQMFDINRNGKVDAMDFFLLHQIYEESHKSTSSDQTTYRNYVPITPPVPSVDSSWETDNVSPINGNIHAGAEDVQEESDDWQLYAYEGDEYGIYPYDYDSREEYMEAVEEAEAAVEAEIAAEEQMAAEEELLLDEEYMDTDEEESLLSGGVSDQEESRILSDTSDQEELSILSDTSDQEVTSISTDEDAAPVEETKPLPDVKDYPNKRSYEAACVLYYYEQWPEEDDNNGELERSKFILEGTCIASRYLTRDGQFLFAQAVKENFDLPITYSDEDTYRMYEPGDIFRKIARYDSTLTLNIWQWVLDEFLPYMKGLEDGNFWGCTTAVLAHMDEYPKEFIPAFKTFAVSNEAFAKKLMTSLDRIPDCLPEWMVDSLESGRTDEAIALLSPLLENLHFDDDDRERLLIAMLGQCKIRDGTEAIELFRDSLLPVFMIHADEPMKRRQPEWKEEIAAYISYEEAHNQAYRYSRSNAWRASYRDEKPDPCHYRTEEEYLTAKEKMQIREAEIQARQARTDESNEKKSIAARQLQNGSVEELEVFEYCSVLLPEADRAYSYLTGGLPLEIGDRVVVPVGADNKEVVGVVASVGKHTRISVPFPVERTKKVLRKAER